jgi:small multidrug resistance pump
MANRTDMTKTYVFLALAILAEVIATTALARSESFTRLWPSVVTVVGYVIAFWLLSHPLRVMPTGIVYAIWSGVGIALVTLIGWRLFGQSLEAGEIAGIALILAGVVVIHVFSDARVD